MAGEQAGLSDWGLDGMELVEGECDIAYMVERAGQTSNSNCCFPSVACRGHSTLHRGPERWARFRNGPTLVSVR